MDDENITFRINSNGIINEFNIKFNVLIQSIYLRNMM